MKSSSVQEIRRWMGDRRLFGLQNMAPSMAESREGIRAGVKRES
jgi:hypothetical protein